jgi:hypothetical protein
LIGWRIGWGGRVKGGRAFQMANGKVQMANGRKIFLVKTGELCRSPIHVGGTNQVFSKKNFRPFAI